VDHEEAGIGMRRGQSIAAVVVTVLMVGGAAYADRELEPRPLGSAPATTAVSGAWFCPHGGGKKDWEVSLQVANPGDVPATIRVRTLGHGRPTDPQTLVVDPSSFLRIPVPGNGRERSSMVEWFDQWVAVGWVAHAGGDEGGVAAEPCAPAAGERWLLPDGTTETEENDDFVIVMNPFSRDAVFSVVILSERQGPVEFGELTDVVLGPHRSRAIRLNDVVRGERTVSTIVEASVGRVAAATLGVSTSGGIRSALGYLGEAPQELVFPGGDDAGRTDLAVMNTSQERVALDGDLLETELELPFAGLADSVPPPESGRTYPSTTSGPTSVVFSAQGPGVAATRRTFGVSSDQASSSGAVPARSWLILPAVVGSPSHPGLVLANPGQEPAVITLSYVGTSSGQSVTVTVPPRRTVAAPVGFLEASPDSAVLAVASEGTFVAAAASYSLGREGFATYAVALGIPIPA
jgi:hypothetical protein